MLSTGNAHWGPLEKGVSDSAKGHSFDEGDRAIERVWSLEEEIATSIYLNTVGQVFHIVVLFSVQHKPTPKGRYCFPHFIC